MISHFLKPEGQFIFAEFHPVVWMFDDTFSTIDYSYFNTGPIQESETGTYADNQAAISQVYVVWNHSISDVLTALLVAGLQLDTFQDFDYSPYACFGDSTVKIGEKGYRIKVLDAKIPMVYALKAFMK